MLIYFVIIITASFSLGADFRIVRQNASAVEGAPKTNVAGLPKGKTTIYSNDNTLPTIFEYDWQAPLTFYYPSENNLVVASVNRLYSSNDVCLAFFSGPNLLKRYVVEEISPDTSQSRAFRIIENPFWKWYELRLSPSGTNTLFYVGTRDGRLLGFNTRTGSLETTELKYRHILFGDWLSDRLRALEKERHRVSVFVGTITAVESKRRIAQLMGVNELMQGKHERSRRVHYDKRFDGQIKQDEEWLFLIIDSGSRNEYISTAQKIGAHASPQGSSAIRIYPF